MESMSGKSGIALPRTLHERFLAGDFHVLLPHMRLMLGNQRQDAVEAVDGRRGRDRRGRAGPRNRP